MSPDAPRGWPQQPSWKGSRWFDKVVLPVATCLFLGSLGCCVLGWLGVDCPAPLRGHAGWRALIVANCVTEAHVQQMHRIRQALRDRGAEAEVVVDGAAARRFGTAGVAGAAAYDDDPAQPWVDLRGFLHRQAADGRHRTCVVAIAPYGSTRTSDWDEVVAECVRANLAVVPVCEDPWARAAVTWQAPTRTRLPPTPPGDDSEFSIALALHDVGRLAPTGRLHVAVEGGQFVAISAPVAGTPLQLEGAGGRELQVAWTGAPEHASWLIWPVERSLLRGHPTSANWWLEDQGRILVAGRRVLAQQPPSVLWVPWWCTLRQRPAGSVDTLGYSAWDFPVDPKEVGSTMRPPWHLLAAGEDRPGGVEVFAGAVASNHSTGLVAPLARCRVCRALPGRRDLLTRYTAVVLDWSSLSAAAMGAHGPSDDRDPATCTVLRTWLQDELPAYLDAGGFVLVLGADAATASEAGGDLSALVPEVGSTAAAEAGPRVFLYHDDSESFARRDTRPWPPVTVRRHEPATGLRGAAQGQWLPQAENTSQQPYEGQSVLPNLASTAESVIRRVAAVLQRAGVRVVLQGREIGPAAADHAPEEEPAGAERVDGWEVGGVLWDAGNKARAEDVVVAILDGEDTGLDGRGRATIGFLQDNRHSAEQRTIDADALYRRVRGALLFCIGGQDPTIGPICRTVYPETGTEDQGYFAGGWGRLSRDLVLWITDRLMQPRQKAGEDRQPMFDLAAAGSTVVPSPRALEAIDRIELLLERQWRPAVSPRQPVKLGASWRVLARHKNGDVMLAVRDHGRGRLAWARVEPGAEAQVQALAEGRLAVDFTPSWSVHDERIRLAPAVMVARTDMVPNQRPGWRIGICAVDPSDAAWPPLPQGDPRPVNGLATVGIQPFFGVRRNGFVGKTVTVQVRDGELRLSEEQWRELAAQRDPTGDAEPTFIFRIDVQTDDALQGEFQLALPCLLLADRTFFLDEPPVPCAWQLVDQMIQAWGRPPGPGLAFDDSSRTLVVRTTDAEITDLELRSPGGEPRTLERLQDVPGLLTFAVPDDVEGECLCRLLGANGDLVTQEAVWVPAFRSNAAFLASEATPGRVSRNVVCGSPLPGDVIAPMLARSTFPVAGAAEGTTGTWRAPGVVSGSFEMSQEAIATRVQELYEETTSRPVSSAWFRWSAVLFALLVAITGLAHGRVVLRSWLVPR